MLVEKLKDIIGALGRAWESFRAEREDGEPCAEALVREDLATREANARLVGMACDGDHPLRDWLRGQIFIQKIPLDVSGKEDRRWPQ
jgi:hypothetical protein